MHNTIYKRKDKRKLSVIRTWFHLRPENTFQTLLTCRRMQIYNSLKSSNSVLNVSGLNYTKLYQNKNSSHSERAALVALNILGIRYLSTQFIATISLFSPCSIIQALTYLLPLANSRITRLQTSNYSSSIRGSLNEAWSHSVCRNSLGWFLPNPVQSTPSRSHLIPESTNVCLCKAEVGSWWKKGLCVQETRIRFFVLYAINYREIYDVHLTHPDGILLTQISFIYG